MSLKNILRYLFPLLIVAIALLCNVEECHSVAVEDTAEVLACDDTPETLDSQELLEPFAHPAGLLFPRRVAGASAVRLQGFAKRSANGYKNNLEFLKAGKVVNAGVRSYIREESLNIHYLFIKPTRRLIGFGKLLI